MQPANAYKQINAYGASPQVASGPQVLRPVGHHSIIPLAI